jgi:hypothetical protein
MTTINVKFIATPEQERAFQYLRDRGLEDGLEAVTGVTEAHELTKELLQKYLNYVADDKDKDNDDSFVHGFDYGFDFGVAMTLLEGAK